MCEWESEDERVWTGGGERTVVRGDGEKQRKEARGSGNRIGGACVRACVRACRRRG